MSSPGRACRHCKSPARGRPCWWHLDHPDYARRGEDPPCVIDDYAAAAKRGRRRGVLTAAAVAAAVLAIALASCILASRAHAQGTAAERAACTASALQFCFAKALAGDGRAVAACLIANKARIAPECRAVLRAHRATD